MFLIFGIHKLVNTFKARAAPAQSNMRISVVGGRFPIENVRLINEVIFCNMAGPNSQDELVMVIDV